MTETGVQTGHAGTSAAPEAPAPQLDVELADGSTVTLHPKASIMLGVAAQSVMRNAILSYVESGDSVAMGAAVEAALSVVYLHYGIRSWTCTDGDGKPVPLTSEAIDRIVTLDNGGMAVVEACDALYSEAVMRPLQQRMARLSPDGPREPSTPPTPSSGPTAQRPSRRSSPAPMDGKPSGVPAP